MTNPDCNLVCHIHVICLNATKSHHGWKIPLHENMQIHLVARFVLFPTAKPCRFYFVELNLSLIHYTLSPHSCVCKQHKTHRHFPPRDAFRHFTLEKLCHLPSTLSLGLAESFHCSLSQPIATDRQKNRHTDRERQTYRQTLSQGLPHGPNSYSALLRGHKR